MGSHQKDVTQSISTGLSPNTTTEEDVKPPKVIIMRRHEWGAPNSKWGSGAPLLRPAKKVFCLVTDKDMCHNITACKREMVHLAKHHMKNDKCPDIKYSFVIGNDGRVYEGRGWKTRPGLPIKFQLENKHSIYIAITGFYKRGRVPKNLLAVRDAFILYGIERNHIDPEYKLFSSVDRLE